MPILTGDVKIVIVIEYENRSVHEESCNLSNFIFRHLSLIHIIDFRNETRV